MESPTDAIFRKFDKNRGLGLSALEEMVYSILEVEKLRKALEEIANHGETGNNYSDLCAVKRTAKKALEL